MYYVVKNTENIVVDGCPIPGNIPGQVEQDSEQRDVVEDVPAHWRGVELHLPTYIIL